MNKESKRKIFSLIIVLLICTICMIYGLNSFTLAVNADSNPSRIELYTNSDKLLNSDGSISTKTILQFSDEVKALDEGDEVVDLTKVIPVEYVRFIEDGYTFQFNGKEYGFFVCHRKLVGGTKLIDVALIDFTYSYIDIKCSAELQLLLQVTLQYHNDNGVETWTIHHENAKKDYYIVNPRFVSILQNENDLNYGDNGYVKSNDYGAIIQQATLNYNGTIIVNDGVTSEEGIAMFHSALSGLADFAIGLIPIPQVGTVYSAIGNICDFVETLRDSIDYEIASLSQGADGEILYKSRGVQENEPETIPFSRVMATAPQNEILLTDDPSSYMRCNTILDNSISRSRIIQCVQFDILQTSKDKPLRNRKFMNDLNDDGEKIPFAAYQEKVLFEDQEPQFNITENNIEGEEIPVYLLQNGQQKIVFNPDYSGYYNFETDADVTISVTDSNGNEVVSEQSDFYLRMGRTYTLTLSNSKSEKVISDLSVNLSDRAPDKETSANEKIILRADFGQDDVYSLSTGNSNVLIDDILVGGTNGLESCDNFYGYKASENISLPLSEGEYFIIVQIRENNAEYNISVSGCEEKELGEEVSVAADGKNYVFVKFSGVAEGKYAIASDSSDEVTYRIYDYSLNRVAFSGANNSGSFNISGNIIYVGILADGNTDFKLNPVGVAYEWRIDGKKIDFNAENELEIGKSYEIELYVNGIKQNSSYLESDNEYCTITSDSKEATLKIKGQCDLGVQFKIDYQVGEVRPFDCDLILQTIYTTAFNGFDIVNDEQILLEWVHGKDLVEIDYTMSKPDGSGDIWEQNYCIELANNAVIGRTYSNDITSQVEGINKVLADVTITINEIKVQMPDGLRSFTMDELGLVSEYTVNCFYGDGFGTQGDPYEISCNRHFENMGLNEKQETHFTITKYLELEGNVINDFKGIIANENLVVISWKPKKAYEMGIILNNYGSISNLQVKIKNEFELYEGCTFGGIVCCNQTGGEIKNCSVTYVKTNLFNHWCTAGGISGLNYGKIQGCWAYVDVTTVGIFGAIVGSNRGEISECQGKGTITQKVELFDGNRYMPSYAGGIAGINFEIGSIENCFAGTKYEEINGKLTYDEAYLNIFIVVNNVDDDTLAPYAGPIAGDNRGAISDCSNQGYYIDTGNLHSWWAWFVTYDQLRNINNII